MYGGRGQKGGGGGGGGGKGGGRTWMMMRRRLGRYNFKKLGCFLVLTHMSETSSHG